MTRIIQISDTHLSARKPHFVPNWAPLRDWITQQAPAFVIHTGDITVDGAGDEEDFAYCAGRLSELRHQVLSVPGNHDVGLHGSEQAVTSERLARWSRHVGADWWLREIPGWRLIGLNTMLFGTGDRREAEQRAWLADVMATAGTRRIAWFMHQPVFLDHPNEADTGYWSIKPGPRKELMDLVRQHRVAVIATGHLHKAHETTLDGTRYVWCPATSFMVGREMQPDMPGRKTLGAVSYDFTDTGCSVTHVVLDQLIPHWIDDVVHEVYPKPGA